MENNALDPSKLIMLTNLALVCHARKSKRQAHAAHANFGSLSTGLIGTPHESGKQLDDLGEVLGSLADGKSLLKRKFWTLEVPGDSWRLLEIPGAMSNLVQGFKDFKRAQRLQWVVRVHGIGTPQMSTCLLKATLNCQVILSFCPATLDIFSCFIWRNLPRTLDSHRLLTLGQPLLSTILDTTNCAE